jgi:Reverse transcriptase (RNA-dependent DNA polymerase).
MPPCQDIQRGPPHSAIPSYMKPRLSDRHPQTGEGSGTAVPYRPISLLDTVGQSFEKILLDKILGEISERGLMRDEQFGFRSKQSTSLLLARLFERVTRNFGVKRLTGTVFLEVAKAFDIVWIDGLLSKLTVLNFPSYLVKTISFSLPGRTSNRPSRHPRHIVVACRFGWHRAVYFPLSISVCILMT